MSINSPIFIIAKDLNVESNKILLACKKLGIYAKGATKRLNEEELEKRKKDWVKPIQKYKRGILSKYSRIVSTSSLGAVTDL